MPGGSREIALWRKIMAQETILRALVISDQFNPGTNLSAWLHTILRHCYFNEARRLQRFSTIKISGRPGLRYSSRRRSALLKAAETIDQNATAPTWEKLFSRDLKNLEGAA